MAAEQGISWAALTAAAPSIIGGAAVSAFAIPVQEYEMATIFSLIGVVARHCYDASKEGQFNLKALAFDLPTAPMLGIIAYTACLYFNIDPIIRGGLIVLGSFLGPEWLRSLGAGLAEILLRRIAGRGRDGDEPHP